MSDLPPDRSQVLTELEHPGGHDLGDASIRESIDRIAEDHQQVVAALRNAAPRLEAWPWLCGCLSGPALLPVGSCHRHTMVAVGTWLLPVPQRGMAAALMVSDTHQVRASH